VDGTPLRADRNPLAAEYGCTERRHYAVLERTYGKKSAVWFQRWRIFFMACAELWGPAGQEWWVRTMCSKRASYRTDRHWRFP